MSDIIDELQWRHLIAQHTDLAALRGELARHRVTFYCGFDPTAPSLHHGNLVQLILMRHLQRAGLRPIALVGGATGLIGDPRQSGERVLQDPEVVAGWGERLREQISRILDFDGPNGAILVNNLEWTGTMSAIEFLRDVGKHFRLGTMLSKEIVAKRLKSEEGISFTEFSYQILQANDYLQLYRRYGCTLETGGNDQWGNLVSGVDLIHKVEGRDVHVLTTPIVTKADGTKFGKSEGGAVWLDPHMLSPYAFYQFWLQTDDADVENFLRMFTFLSPERIGAVLAEHRARPGARLAQRTLAEEVTGLVHGAQRLAEVQAATSALWGGGDLHELDAGTLAEATAELPSASIEVGRDTIVDALIAAGLERGRSAARRTVAAGGAYLNNEKVTDEDAPIRSSDLLAGGVALVRRGHRTLAVVHAERS